MPFHLIQGPCLETLKSKVNSSLSMSFIRIQNESSPSVGAITRAQMRYVPAVCTWKL
jgi:hypothetical protein